MNMIQKSLGLGFSLLITSALADDTPKPVVIDHTSAALRNVATRFWAAEYVKGDRKVQRGAVEKCGT
jgi:hypothetical protein